MSIVLEVPDSIVEAIRFPRNEIPLRLRYELATALYRQDLLSFSKASELAGLTRENFATELSRRNIHRHYSEEDTALDEAYAGKR